MTAMTICIDGSRIFDFELIELGERAELSYQAIQINTFFFVTISSGHSLQELAEPVFNRDHINIWLSDVRIRMFSVVLFCIGNQGIKVIVADCVIKLP